MGDAFVEGGSYLYLFTFGNRRLLHQSTGGFVEDKVSGRKVDTALLYPMPRNDLAVLLNAIQPKTVFVHHFDQWRNPFSDGTLESNLRRAERFSSDVNAIDNRTKVIIPNFFLSHRFD